MNAITNVTPPAWIKTAANALLFQLCWVACVIGGNDWALPSLLLMIVCQLVWITEQERLYPQAVAILPLISAGIIFDTGLMHVGLLSFSQHDSIIIPFWLMALWMAFAFTLHHSLAAIVKRPLLAALFGGLGAPWSYFLGSKLGSITANEQGLIIIGIFWALLLFIFSHFQQQGDHDE